MRDRPRRLGAGCAAPLRERAQDRARCLAQGKVVGAICHAGSVLVSAKVLKGKTITCVAAIKDDMINAGATYVDREVVVDGKLVTSRTPGDLPAFMREIIKVMKG